MLQLLEVFGSLFRRELQDAAFGPPGVPGNPERIVHLARRIGNVYRSMFEWSLALRRVRTDKELLPLFDHTASGISSAIASFDRFHSEFSEKISELVRNPPKEGEKRLIAIDFTLDLPPRYLEEQQRIMREVAKKLGVPLDSSH